MRLFVPSDLKIINEWRVQWGMPELSLSQVPALGAFEPGVAVCFLYQTDSDLGFLDELVSNPQCSREQRLQAVHSGFSMLLSESKARGVKRLMALTTNFSSTKVATEVGFDIVPGYLVSVRKVG